jgi:hypothetical protein
VAKKVASFADKLKKAAVEKEAREMVKYVKAYKTESGSWKFRTVVVEVTDENRKEIYG